MAGSALMLILGCLIAIAVIVFLSNAAPSKGVEAAAASTTAEAATSDAGGTGASTGASTGAGAGAGAGATGADMGAGAGSLATQNYAAASSSNKDTLLSGETLAEGASLTSKNGKYVFTYEYGTATMKSGNFTMWSSSGRPATGGVVKITDDGNLGIFPSQYSVTPSGWASGTAGQGTKPYSLIVRDAGQLIMLDSTPTVIWTAPVTMPPVGVDCVMGDWGEWSACSKNCGGGTQTRTRMAITQPNAGGQACGDLTESKPCNTDPCPDCAFTWAPFGQCVTQSPSTGAGKKQSQLLVSSPSGPGGAVCPDPNSNIQDCVNCVFSPWNPTGELSAQTCNQTTGKKTQSRTITVPASGGGSCTEPTTREEACTVNCQLNPWPSTWSTCGNKVNGVGKQTRTTTVKYPAQNGGKACSTGANGVLSAGQSCDANGNCTEERECKDCVLGTTFTPGNCDPATGRKSRTRTGDVAPTNGGIDCPAVTDEVDCDVNCEVSGWSGVGEGWGTCDPVQAKQTRTRTVTQQPKNSGTACPALTETRDCAINAVCDWETSCSRACNGIQRKIEVSAAKNGGKSCQQQKDDAIAQMTAVWVQDGVTNETPTVERVGWERRCNTEPAKCAVTLYDVDENSGAKLDLPPGEYGDLNNPTGAIGGLTAMRNRASKINVPDGAMVALYRNNGWVNEWAWRGPFTGGIGGHNNDSVSARVAMVEPIPVGSYSVATDLGNNGHVVLSGVTLATFGGKDGAGGECKRICDQTNGCAGFTQWSNMGGGTWGDCVLHTAVTGAQSKSQNGSATTYRRSAPTAGLTKDQIKSIQYESQAGADSLWSDYRGPKSPYDAALPGSIFR